MTSFKKDVQYSVRNEGNPRLKKNNKTVFLNNDLTLDS